MAVICITYDLNKLGQRYKELDDAIQGLNLGGGRALASCWFVLGNTKTPQQIYQSIRSALDANDEICVFYAKGPMMAEGLSQEWKTWLGNNLA